MPCCISKLTWRAAGAALAAALLVGCPAQRPPLQGMTPPISMDGDAAARRARALQLVKRTLTVDWIFGGRPKLEYINDSEIRFSQGEIVRDGPLLRNETEFRTIAWSEVTETKIRRHTDPIVPAYIVEVHVKRGRLASATHYDWYARDEDEARRLAWAVELLADRLPGWRGDGAPQTPMATPPAGGCTHDMQCKGARTCTAGRCVAPAKRLQTVCENDLECPGEQICQQRVCRRPSVGRP